MTIKKTHTSIYLLYAILVLLILSSKIAVAQIGGVSSFKSLDLPSNPITTGLGGINVSVNEANPSEILNNPALLDTSDVKHISLNITPYFSGANFGNLSYAGLLGKQLLAGGIQYNSLGTFVQTDNFGNEIGTFTVNDLAFYLSHSRKQGNITFGATLKYASTSFVDYQSGAIVADLGAYFKHPKIDLSYGMCVKNIGLYSNSNQYTDENPSLPFDVQLGLTYKPMYMPVRFSFQAHHIHQYNISYLDNSQIRYDLFGNRIVEKIGFMDNLFRHFIFGTEIVLDKGFQILLSYNHLRNKDFYTEIGGGMNGIALGFKLKISNIKLNYSYSAVHTAGNFSSFGLIYQL